MAINPEMKYPGKVADPSPQYPYGEARNVTVPGDGTGTPFESGIVNDLFGFQQSLLSAAGIVPSGTPEKVGASQYLQALTKLFKPTFETVADMTSTPNALGITFFEGQELETKQRNSTTKTGGAIYRVFNSATVVPWLNKTAGTAVTENPIYAYPLDGGLIAVAKEVKVMNFIEGLRANPQDYGVVYGSSLSQQAREDNSGYLQECFNDADEVQIRGTVETYGKVLLRNGIRVEGQTALKGSIIGCHPTEATLTDGTITAPNDQTNNLWNVTLKELGVRSINADAIHVTPYQCMIERCRIQADNGNGILHHDGGYQVENTYKNNYFIQCLKGISAPGGFRGPTDQYILDNYFYANGISQRHVDLTGLSGSLLKGNHYYGNALREYVRLGQGVNVRLIGEYFEGNNGNARLRLDGGNPNSISLTSCDFWQGDGNATDWEGHQETLIKCNISSGNFFQLGMSGNTFNGGVNGVPIFGFSNGDSTNTGGTSIPFDRSNIISGSYDLVANVGSGNVSDTVIQSNHPEFYKFQSTQNFDFFGATGSEIFQEDTGSATSFPGLPASVFWLTDKLLIINNVSVTTALSFSAGGGTLVTGLNPVPPGTRVAITRRGSGYFIFKY